MNVSSIQAAMNTAKSNGLNRPKLRVGRFIISTAPATGSNPGALYVKTKNEMYVGKIVNGVFYPAIGRDSTALAEFTEIAKGDLLEAAVSYGRETGECSCCGRTLTDPVSIANGIGPICAGKFGFDSADEEDQF